MVLKRWNLPLHSGREQGVLVELHQLKSCYNYFTIILQSSVGTPEGHSEVGAYLASFCVPNLEHLIPQPANLHMNSDYLYLNWDLNPPITV